MSEEKREIAVSTFLWHDSARQRGYEFRHDHVRILKSMVERNLSLPHRFVCVTDDEIDGIDCVPLDWTKHVPGTCFIRLMLRRPDIAGILGERIFNLDLDVVITGDLAPIISRAEPCVWWRNPNFPAPRRAFYQTSVQLFTAGTHPELWADFDPVETPRWVNWRFGGAEQAWVSEKLLWDMPYWDASHGIYGAGRLGDWNDNQVVAELPENARIVSFPGNREPSQPEVQTKMPWVKEHYR